MFRKIIKSIKKYFQIEPMVENPFGRKTTGVKLTVKNKDERLEDKINEVISNCLYPANVKFTMKSRLKDDLNMDSFDFVEMIMYLEEEFMVELTDEVIENCYTVRDIHNVVKLTMEVITAYENTTKSK